MLEQPQEGNAPRPPLPLPLRPIGGEAPASDTAHNDETNAPNPADYAVMARAALERVEELSKQIEGLEGLVPMCREAWRDYGQPMRAQRLLEPSDKKFGAWVKESRADTGRASSPVTRTDAMWVAEHWATLSTLKLRNHHPSHLRQECRDAGHEWAFEQPRAGGPGNPTPPTDSNSDGPSDTPSASTAPVARTPRAKKGRNGHLHRAERGKRQFKRMSSATDKAAGFWNCAQHVAEAIEDGTAPPLDSWREHLGHITPDEAGNYAAKIAAYFTRIAEDHLHSAGTPSNGPETGTVL